MSFLAIVAAAAALQGAPDAQQTAPSEPASPVQPAKAEMICRMEDVPNTRFKKKVCRTKEQAEQQENASQRDLDRMRSSAQIGGRY